ASAAFLLAPVLVQAQPSLATPAFLQVTVYPQTEVFSIVDYLGRGKRDISVPSDYKTSVEAHFRKYEQQPVVKFWQTLQKKYNLLPGEAGARFSVAEGRFLLSPASLPATPATSKNLMTPAEWKTLEELVNNFAAASGYSDFHKNNRARYQQWEQALQMAIDKGGYFNKLSAFAGREKNFGLHPDPLNAWGPYHVTPENKTDAQHFALLVWGYHKSKLAGPDTPPVFTDSAMLNNTLWHEMAHTYINPLVAQHAAGIKNLPAAEKVRRNASRYYELLADVAISELLVRGMVASLARQHSGDAAAEKEIARQLRTFGYDIAKTEELFTQHYLKNRSKYPTLESFFPV
ncbi:MAG: DUF4932 domain-containing protein, partial [Sphingobacteriales bacterium]